MAKKIVEVYQSRSKNKDWRWRLVASNGKIVGASSEGFSSKATAKRNVKSLHTALGVAEVVVKVPKKASTKTTKPAKVAKPAVKSTKPRATKAPAAKDAKAPRNNRKPLAAKTSKASDLQVVA